MIDDSKHIRSGVDGVRDDRGNSDSKMTVRKSRLISGGSNFLIPMFAGVLQITVGMSLVAVSILGLITPLWLSAFFSLIGSVSSMAGVFLVYHALSSKGTFDSLINQAIKRVINAQN
ncbi:hypothetical protein [Rhodohalobacter mucosus]|uniref:Uncharacterized protein n=1 Tax=Rhodohalobacter mucosus TaxID=2079485 RepID=A0A316TKS0_9BACT|nr:hypothetical protein [Rhodohalobacter mucosus]PWN05143.1 hypothetical protein DDZ15_15560 [Rhodohalobacter mucosus]